MVLVSIDTDPIYTLGALSDIDVKTCVYCVGSVKVIACIEDQQVIDKILPTLRKSTGCHHPPMLYPKPERHHK